MDHVGPRELRELLVRASDQVAERWVGLYEGTLGVHQRHAGGRVLEQAAEALLARSQGGLGAAPLGQVGGRAGYPDHLAAPVGEGHAAVGDNGHRAVLAQELGLPLEQLAALAPHRLRELFEVLLPPLDGHEVEERLADQLSRAVAVHALRGAAHEVEAAVTAHGPDQILSGLDERAVALLAAPQALGGEPPVRHVDHHAAEAAGAGQVDRVVAHEPVPALALRCRRRATQLHRRGWGARGEHVAQDPVHLRREVRHHLGDGAPDVILGWDAIHMGQRVVDA